MYQNLAHLYDWPGALDFSEKILERDLALFQEMNVLPPSRVIDLACGTGTLAIELAKRGYQTIGIDISVAMLEQAQAKQTELEAEDNSAKAKSLPVQWRTEDMRYFLTDETAPSHAVLCHYDSLNHLSNETELRGVFIQVAQALQPGGLFVFDLNTLENYQTFWNGRDSYEGPNYRLKTLAQFNEDTHQAEVQFMVDEYTDEGKLVSQSETVYEHYFSEAAVEKYLMAADFQDICWEPFNPVDDLPAEFPLKTFWHCKRR